MAAFPARIPAITAVEEVILQFTVTPRKGLFQRGALARRNLVEIHSTPCLVGKTGCAVPGAVRDLFTVRRAGEGFVLEPMADVPVSLGGIGLQGQASLVPGMQMEVDGLLLKCHFRRPARPVSFWSQALSYLAKTGVGIFLLFEFWVMLGLPVLLKNANFWEKDLASQRISRKLDTLRKRVDKLDSKEEMRMALYREISQELLSEARYIRANDDNIRRSERLKMLDNLERIQSLLDRMEKDETFGQAVKPNLDEAVRRIIQ